MWPQWRYDDYTAAGATCRRHGACRGPVDRAADLPGPPVQLTTEKDGKVVMRARMLRAR
jgi:hypothetical protein